jgi:hypothetical protein
MRFLDLVIITRKGWKMLCLSETTYYSIDQGSRARKLFSAVVLAALDDAIADERRTRKGTEAIARWARSRDGQEVQSNAGIESNERTVENMKTFVQRGVTTSTALSRAQAGRNQNLQAT